MTKIKPLILDPFSLIKPVLLLKLKMKSHSFRLLRLMGFIFALFVH